MTWHPSIVNDFNRNPKLHSMWSKSLVIQRPEVSKLEEMNRFFELLAEIDNIFKFLCVEKVQEILQQTRNPLF
jgi:hypothetical protein